MKEIIQAQIEILESFTPVIAYTGDLANIRQGSYIPYGEFLIVLNELKRQQKLLLKDLNEIQ